MATLSFRTRTQQALFNCELAGQISDGHWENARPYDHWKPWCKCDVVVEPHNLGRDFYADRANYNFTNRDLLAVVGGRMLCYARGALMSLTDAECELLEYCVDDETGNWDWTDGKYLSNNNYWARKNLEIQALMRSFRERNGYTLRTAYEGTAHNYGMRELKKDLTEMKQIVRTYRIS